VEIGRFTPDAPTSGKSCTRLGGARKAKLQYPELHGLRSYTRASFTQVSLAPGRQRKILAVTCTEPPRARIAGRTFVKFPGPLISSRDKVAHGRSSERLLQGISLPGTRHWTWALYPKILISLNYRSRRPSQENGGAAMTPPHFRRVVDGLRRLMQTGSAWH
jgi:hypothetical protein